MAVGAAIPLITAASSVLGNMMGASESSRQRDWQEMMWEKNNEYNTPQNQMRRLRQAGINPHFAISGGQLGTGTSSSPANTYQPAQYDFSPIGEGVARSVELSQQRQLNDAEIDYKNQQAQNWSIKNITQLWHDYTEIQNMIKQGKLSDQELEVAKGQAMTIWTNLQSLARSNEVNIEKAVSEKRLNDVRARVEEAHAVYQELLNSFAPEQQRIITENLRKEGSKIDSEVNRNNKEGALAAANVALSNAQKNGVVIDNNTKSKMAQYIVDEKYAQADEATYRAANERKQYYGGRVGHELPSHGFMDDEQYGRNVAPPRRPR